MSGSPKGREYVISIYGSSASGADTVMIKVCQALPRYSNEKFVCGICERREIDIDGISCTIKFVVTANLEPCDAYILVYDVGSKLTFEKALKTCDELDKFGVYPVVRAPRTHFFKSERGIHENMCPIMLMGTNFNPHVQRQVSVAEATEMSAELECSFVEISNETSVLNGILREFVGTLCHDDNHPVLFEPFNNKTFILWWKYWHSLYNRECSHRIHGFRAEKDPEKVLFSAVRLNAGEEVKRLLAAGVDFNKPIPSRRPLLVIAVSKGNSYIVGILLELGIDPNIQDSDGLSPLHSACLCGDSGILNLLLRFGASSTTISAQHGTALSVAVRKQNVPCIKILLKHGVDPNLKYHGHESDLHLAIARGDVHIARLLIEAGSDLSAQSLDGSTPLLTACHLGHCDIVRLLLDNGANADLPSGRFASALDAAISGKQLDVVDVLLAFDAQWSHLRSAYNFGKPLSSDNTSTAPRQPQQAFAAAQPSQAQPSELPGSMWYTSVANTTNTQGLSANTYGPMQATGSSRVLMGNYHNQVNHFYAIIAAQSQTWPHALYASSAPNHNGAQPGFGQHFAWPDQSTEGNQTPMELD